MCYLCFIESTASQAQKKHATEKRSVSTFTCDMCNSTLNIGLKDPDSNNCCFDCWDKHWERLRDEWDGMGPGQIYSSSAGL